MTFVTALLPVVLVIPAHPCSMAACLNHGNEMRPSFVVKVTHGRTPLRGVSVEILSEQNANSSKQFISATSSDGVVHVADLAPGEYWLNAEFLGISAAYQCFHVAAEPSRKAKKKLSFQWGGFAPATRHVAGKLVDSQPGKGGTPPWNAVHRVEVPIRGATMRLQDPFTGATYQTRSDAMGEFAFELVPSGTYVLHIDAGNVGSDRSYDATDMLVKVSGKAMSDMLLLTRREPGGGSCGGLYLELRTSKQLTHAATGNPGGL